MRSSKSPLELILSEEVQKLMDNLANVFDIRVSFFSCDGVMLRRGSAMSNTSYCILVQEKLGQLNRCLELDRDKRQEASQGAIVYTCHAGLREAIVPVQIEHQLVGYLMIGQFRTGDTLPECAVQYCRTPEERVELEKSFLALPKITEERLADILGLLRALTDYFIVKELAILRKDQLKIAIDQFLEQNCTKEIRLEKMAKTLGKSVSTISQFLRDKYNTTFSKMLNEHRLRAAENFWRSHPDASCAECAKVAGFRDQFYFARVFRKFRGITPSSARRALR